ncbi:hypothetical protein EUTSA_v10002880mg [Eutrema salsugineum]|uniref:F-box domain-containing protein n=1 Tax=Eutrema salsugineum TaxID=72664 RepID=V4KH58_EUTSA|nr:hypothetical protein EUTSA_v10002880mg [Eutrema salsugineum]
MRKRGAQKVEPNLTESSDVTIEILLRLSAKSIGKFRCVSKLWSSMTTTPGFVKSFSVHSSARPSLLSFKNEEDKRNYFMDRFDIPQSVQGLVSLANLESVKIWNPTLRQHVTLPQPKVSKPLVSLLGYDPIGSEYKVLCMSLICDDAREDHRPIHCQMKSWRCIKGVDYYIKANLTIVSFNVRSEKFGVIQIP